MILEHVAQQQKVTIKLERGAFAGTFPPAQRMLVSTARELLTAAGWVRSPSCRRPSFPGWPGGLTRTGSRAPLRLALPSVPDAALSGVPGAADLPTPERRRRDGVMVASALLGEASYEVEGGGGR